MAVTHHDEAAALPASLPEAQGARPPPGLLRGPHDSGDRNGHSIRSNWVGKAGLPHHSQSVQGTNHPEDNFVTVQVSYFCSKPSSFSH